MKRKTKLLSVLLTLTIGIAALGTMAGCGFFDSDKNSSSSSNTTPHNGNSSNANTDQDDPIPPTGTQGLKYTLSDDKTYYSVTGYKGTANTVYIPDTYEDLPVKAIGFDPFEDCENVTRIIIGNNVTSISDYAFVSCLNLTNISVSENNTEYKSIDGNLYSANGKKLMRYAIGKTDTKFTIPNGVIFIGDGAFRNDSNLTEIIIPDSVTAISDWAFSKCSSLTEIIIPDSVTSIGYASFSYCTNLTEVVIPDSITSIGDHAFHGCDSLTEIIIPDSVTSIGEWAFGACDSLTEIIIPDGVTSIGEWAFARCWILTIYCEVESKPDGWASDWNYYCPVEWGYTGEN